MSAAIGKIWSETSGGNNTAAYSGSNKLLCDLFVELLYNMFASCRSLLKIITKLMNMHAYTVSACIYGIQQNPEREQIIYKII